MRVTVENDFPDKYIVNRREAETLLFYNTECLTFKKTYCFYFHYLFMNSTENRTRIIYDVILLSTSRKIIIIRYRRILCYQMLFCIIKLFRRFIPPEPSENMIFLRG